jgi:hypothetical protein
MDSDSDIEIRPCFGVDDFAPVDPTGQLRAEEHALSERISHMSEDEAAIRRLIAAWSRALEAKDLDGLVADYADDAVLFDAIPRTKQSEKRPFVKCGPTACRTSPNISSLNIVTS